jgi:hypothetical protein
MKKLLIILSILAIPFSPMALAGSCDGEGHTHSQDSKKDKKLGA